MNESIQIQNTNCLIYKQIEIKLTPGKDAPKEIIEGRKKGITKLANNFNQQFEILYQKNLQRRRLYAWIVLSKARKLDNH